MWSGKGDTHPNAKLSDDDVRTIRRLRNTGKWTIQGIANSYKVSYGTVHGILTGKTWGHVKD